MVWDGISVRSARTGGGKKELLKRSAFPSGVISKEPSDLVSDGVMAIDSCVCRFTAHLAIFHRPLGVDVLCPGDSVEAVC